MVDLSENVDALREVSMKRTTFTKIIKSVAASHKIELFQALLSNKFSILFDESTDVTSKKHGCVIVRYFDNKSKKIVSALWAMDSIYKDDDDDSEASAQVLYERILESFDHFEVILRENLIAFGSDGCSTMTGAHNSVAQKFRRDFIGLNTISCPCHATHLCASYAAREIPR